MRKALCFWGALALSTAIVMPVKAGEVDVLVDKLVEKGVLTPTEGQIILDETKNDVAKQIAESRSSTLPLWVQNTKIKGDFRLRNQYEKKHLSAEGRSRGRFRYRLEIESKITNQVRVGAGLASGSSDPRSNNQTFENSFDTPDIRLNLAYAEYAPTNWAKIIGGKFKRDAYLWQTTDMVWDSDINPEGGSISLTHPLIGKLDGFVNSGVWTIDEIDGNTGFTNTDHQDPFLVYVQPGVKYENNKVDATLAGILYNYSGVKGMSLENGKSTNTLTGTVLKYDYDAGGVSAELGVAELFGGLPMKIDERIAIFGDYIDNPDPSSQNVGWSAGMKFGNKKVGDPKTWQARYMYVYLGKDAVLDILPDSDRYGGSTDIKGYEGILEYALKKNIILGLDYYQTQRIKAVHNLEHLIQADLLFKF